MLLAAVIVIVLFVAGAWRRLCPGAYRTSWSRWSTSSAAS
jgi:hypothetical protein